MLTPSVLVSDPADRPRPVLMIVIHDRAPNRRDDLQLLVGRVLDLDGLHVMVEFAWAVGRQIRIAIIRIRLDNHNVAPISLAVGESPSDVAIAADDDRRSAGQRASSHVTQVFVSIGNRPGESGAIPDVGHANAQVHIVGQQGPAVCRIRTRYGPVIASQMHALDGRQMPWRCQ